VLCYDETKQGPRREPGCRRRAMCSSRPAAFRAVSGRSRPPAVSGGRPPRYCDRADHNAQSAFRARRRRPEDPATTGGPSDGGDRPVSLAAMTLRGVAQRFAEDLQRGLDALQVLTDVEQLEAELASVHADTHAEVSRAEQRAATEQRARIEASEAAEDALAATEEARARADAAQAQADAAPTRTTGESERHCGAVSCRSPWRCASSRPALRTARCLRSC
jgi:hypothetical protein